MHAGLGRFAFRDGYIVTYEEANGTGVYYDETGSGKMLGSDLICILEGVTDVDGYAFA